jgi:hypothetical protein
MFGRGASIEQKNGLQVFFDAVNGEPEEVDIQVLVKAPAGGDVIVVRRLDEKLIDDAVLVGV